MLIRYSFLFILILASQFAFASDSTSEFVEESFAGVEPELKTLWLKKDLKQAIKDKIDYQFHQLRVRYWGMNQMTLWILEEIGKEQPITFGIVVENDKVKKLEVLEYRESRGGEIQHNFFTSQFSDIELDNSQKNLKLSERIDGITGATLSVRASKKVATLALFLHQLTPYSLHGEN